MSITTSLLTATCVDVQPVRFRRTLDGSQVFATQELIVSLDEGSRFQLCIHLHDGVASLASGKAVVYPALEEVPA